MSDTEIFIVQEVITDLDGFTSVRGCGGFARTLLHSGSCGTWPKGVKVGDRIALSLIMGCVCSWEVLRKGETK